MILVNFVFAFYRRGEVEVNKNAKKNTRPVNSYLDQRGFVNTGFIIWTKTDFLERQTREILCGQMVISYLIEYPIRTEDSPHLARWRIQLYYKIHSRPTSFVTADMTTK